MTDALSLLDEEGVAAFVKQVAKETEAIECCDVPGAKRDAVARSSLSRAVAYSSVLLSVYLRQPAIELSSAIRTVLFD